MKHPASLRSNGISEGFLCCRGVKMECGDMTQKWCGLFPPDKIHLWWVFLATKVALTTVIVYVAYFVHFGCRWEGIAKHMVTWVADMISENETNNVISGNLGMFDDMIMSMNTRHSEYNSDTDMPTVKFLQCASQAKASRRLMWYHCGFKYKLLWAQQMFLSHQISMPVSTSALRCYLTWVRCCIWWSTPQAAKKCCNWLRGDYCTSWNVVSVGIKKATFVSKSITMPLVIWAGAQRHGALWVTWSGRWEHFHQVLKLMYRASSIDCWCYNTTFVAFCSVSNRIAQIYKEALFGCRRVELVAALQAGLQAAALSTIVVFWGAKYTTREGKHVRIRACPAFGSSKGPWQDNAIVEFDVSDDAHVQETQLGYVRVRVVFEMKGDHYMESKNSTLQQKFRNYAGDSSP
jgi:hypothetical protein